MEERMAAVHDHIAALHADAEAERTVRRGRRPQRRPGRPLGPSLRRRAGRALVALGEFISGPAAEREARPDVMAAARS